MKHIQVSISIVTVLCLGWWLKPVVPHQSSSFSQLLILPVKKCVYVLIKTSAMSLIIVHSQIRPLQDIHDLMWRCHSVVCGPIYMCKHSVALCVRFIGYTQCTVYCLREMMILLQMSSLRWLYLQFWTSRSLECLNCTPKLITVWRLWECIESVRRLLVSWS